MKWLALPVLLFVLNAVKAAELENAATGAESAAGEAAPAHDNLPLWEAGLFGFGISQPAYPGAADLASLIFGLPYLIYRGKYLRIDRGTVGVRAIRTERIELDVGFAASLGTRADNVEARRGMSDLGMLVEFGPRLKINLGEFHDGQYHSRIQIPLRGVFDLNDHLAFRGFASELQWVMDVELPDKWLVTSNLGVMAGDQQLADTFYRVAPAEATATRPRYDAKAGLIATRATLLASHYLDSGMRFVSYLRYDSVVGAANHDSPLVREDTGWTLGLGLMWTWAQSDRLAQD